MSGVGASCGAVGGERIGDVGCGGFEGGDGGVVEVYWAAGAGPEGCETSA